MTERYNINSVSIFMQRIAGMNPQEFLNRHQLETYAVTVQELLQKHLAVLHRSILEKTLGLADGTQHTAEDTAKSLKISKEKVCALEKQALLQLQNPAIRQQFKNKLLAIVPIPSPPDQTP